MGLISSVRCQEKSSGNGQMGFGKGHMPANPFKQNLEIRHDEEPTPTNAAPEIRHDEDPTPKPTETTPENRQEEVPVPVRTNPDKPGVTDK